MLPHLNSLHRYLGDFSFHESMLLRKMHYTAASLNTMTLNDKTCNPYCVNHLLSSS